MASSISPENNESEHPEHQPDDQNEKPHPAMARQPSLLSLTLDEIQNTVCEPGKTFGSMNMDEFLTNIWTAEEGTAMATAAAAVPLPPPPLLRQNSSVSLPPALWRKTVDEVWSEIQHHRPHPHHQHHHQNIAPQSVPRQPTLGEMTLEDFLIKAGVVRDGGGAAAVPCSMQQLEQVQAPYGAMIGATNAYVEQPQNSFHQRAMAGNGHRHPHHPRIGSPSSPASSDGFSGAAGMKRGPDGGSDRVMERRQRRMIKNRESAARSRARKQAYTVELETELNQLKEENARLQEEQRRLAAQRRQMAMKTMAEKAAQAMAGKRGFKALRHCNSCNW